MADQDQPRAAPAGREQGRAGSPPSSVLVRAAAVTVLVVGVVASAASGVAWTRAVERDRASSLEATTTAATATVSSRVERSLDLIEHLQGLVVTRSDLTNREFLEYWEAAGIPEQFPGALGFASIVRVPADELDRFGAARVDDPVTGLPTGETFTVFPDTPPRAEYCLQEVGLWEVSAFEGFQVPPGLDFCVTDLPGLEESPLPAWLDVATETGRSVAGTVEQTPGLYNIIVPVYEGGTTPPTVESRRAASIGWVSTSLVAAALTEGALGDSSGLAIEVTHTGPGGDEAIVSAAESGGDESEDVVSTTEVQPGWTARIVGAPQTSGPSADQQGLFVFGAGLVASIGAFLFIWLLGSSRKRALDLVDERTGQLAHQALHDGLTGLPNRTLILDRATTVLARAARENLSVAAMFLDLDDFKGINDTLGHGAGDELLTSVARRLTAALRGSDTVGRVGGDEFVVLVEGDSLLAGPEAVAERLLDVMREPFVLDGEPHHVSVSIGIATGPRSDVDEWLRDADIALYEAKAGGKNRYALFASEMHDLVRSRVDLQRDLHHALDGGQFFLLYQPTFDLRTDETTGVEALIRWAHPRDGVIMPDDFVPMAEETGLIVPIGRWVLNEACRQGAEWRRRGQRLSMSVNIAARQLERDDLVDHVRSALTESGLDPAALVLEVTETTLMRDTTGTQRRLEHLKELGVQLAIDDFGAGYSSLGYLRRFPVDVLKIDRSFVAGIADSGDAAVLVRTLVQLGKALGLETLAEGIEDRAQLASLVQEHCDRGQGFLFARPLPPERLEEFLEMDRPPASTTGPGGTRS